MNSPTYLPKVRVEKSGNKNKDDLRVMIAGVFACILFLFGQTAYEKLYDQFYADRPFITATLKLVHVNNQLDPLIEYDADPIQNVSGMWIGSVYTAKGVRLASRRGEGNYLVKDDEPRLWAWDAWFDNEHTDPPAIPAEPFYICVRYVVEANDSGVDDSTDKFCSAVYDAADPLHSISDYIVDGDIP